jgi:hypothetical protein
MAHTGDNMTISMHRGAPADLFGFLPTRIAFVSSPNTHANAIRHFLACLQGRYELSPSFVRRRAGWDCNASFGQYTVSLTPQRRPKGNTQPL